MKETLRRTWRTFFQAAIGYISINLLYAVSSGGNDFELLKDGLIGLCVSAVAAGLAALMNLPSKSGDKNPNKEGENN